MSYKKRLQGIVIAGSVALAAPVFAQTPSASMLGNTCAGCHGTNGNSNGLRIAATGVQSQPVRLKSLERHLDNKDLADIELKKIIEAELKNIKLVRHQGIPPSYKREILNVLIEQNVHDCAPKKGGNQDETSG